MFLLNSDIATVDKRYPDEDVSYEYIGMLSMDEDFPLSIYFNESIGGSTITEDWDNFNLAEYTDRITNIDELVNDMETVSEVGKSTVMRIRPNEKLELHREASVLQKNLAAVTTMEKAAYLSWNNTQIQYIDGTFAIEAGGAFTTLDEYEFTAYAQQQGEELPVIKDMLSNIKEEVKSVALRKYAANDYLRFTSTARVSIYVSDTDLLVKPEIEALKNSDMSLDDKVAKAKQIAMADAMEQLDDTNDILGGVSISFDSLEADIDNMNWDELLIPEDEE